VKVLPVIAEDQDEDATCQLGPHRVY
jgi:hypothetical protein